MAPTNTTTKAQKTVTCRVSAEDHEALSAVALEAGVSMSAYCGDILTKAINGELIDREIAEATVLENTKFPVDEFGVRIPVLTNHVDKKGRCTRCGCIKLLKPVPRGRTALGRHYELWCDHCIQRFHKEIAR